MKEQKIETLLEVLIDKIRELELECNLMKYERDELRKENKSLKKGVSDNG